MHIYIPYTPTHMHTYALIYTHTNIYIHIYTHTYAYIYIHTYLSKLSIMLQLI